MRHNLYIGILISPYRVDFCNWLYEHYDCEIYHLMERDDTAAFDVAAVETLCRFERHYLPTGKIGRRVYARGLRRLIEERNPDVVFVPEFSLTAMEVLWIRRQTGLKFKVVSGCDDSMDMIRGNDFSRMHRMLRRVMPRYFDNLILVNEEVTLWYREHFGKGVCLPIIADESRVRRQMEEALPLCPDLRRQYGLEGRKIILFVGRLVALKNVGLLLRAASGADATVVIVGDGEMRSEWEEVARQSGVETVFTGKKTGLELLAWYLLADVFVLPSLQEAFGAVVNEALMAGCPAVVSSAAGASSLINERNGAVFASDSRDDLSACLQRLLEAAPYREEIGLRDSLMPFTFAGAIATAMKNL